MGYAIVSQKSQNYWYDDPVFNGKIAYLHDITIPYSQGFHTTRETGNY